VITIESPKQILAVAGVDNKGGDTILTVATAEEGHPNALVVTVYVVVEPGVTIAVFVPVDMAPALHV